MVRRWANVPSNVYLKSEVLSWKTVSGDSEACAPWGLCKSLQIAPVMEHSAAVALVAPGSAWQQTSTDQKCSKIETSIVAFLGLAAFITKQKPHLKINTIFQKRLLQIEGHFCLFCQIGRNVARMPHWKCVSLLNFASCRDWMFMPARICCGVLLLLWLPQWEYSCLGIIFGGRLITSS